MAMIQAADQVKVFCKAATTPEEKCLIDVGEKCISTATKLSVEVEKITELHKKGKGNVIAAVHGAFESWRKKNKMNDLDNNLRRYTETMQTLLITRVCDQNEARHLKQGQDFNNLDQGLKAFISRIAEGHNKIGHLLRDEAKTTREHITNEATRAVDSVNAYITTQAENRERREATSTQRQRFLRSFRFKEMNERMNAITDPEDACFDRILESFEKTADVKIQSSSVSIESKMSSEDSLEEIDRLWHSFADWLQSDGYLFWIQGKPGSGKSTLVKYVASKKVTQTLLNQWNPRTRILSHFFWKLGTYLQNDIKGLYCSLLHQLLEGRDELTSSTLDALPTSNSKESYHDWSVPELHGILLKVLELATDKEHLCIFIDGLDEFVGEGGQEVIMQILSDFKRFRKVKVCVTSRPEPWLKEELDTVPNLKLHDLTAPDMRKWIQGKLQQFERKGTFGPEFSSLLVDMLLHKAGGVFLWICLATQSIIREKLEDLYYNMWKRLGDDEPLYRKSAAAYMHFMVGFRSMKEDRDIEYCPGFGASSRLTVIKMASASRPDVRRILTTATEDVDYETLNALCETTENDILTNCAGLLEVYPAAKFFHIHDPVSRMTGRIEFVHRTAYDFLLGTEAGQKILSYSDMSDCEMEVLIFYGVLCWMRVLHDAFSVRRESIMVTQGLPRLLTLQGSENDAQKVKDLRTTIRSFHVDGILAPGYKLWPPTPFASTTVRLRAIFELEVKDVDSNMATSVLQGIPWHEIRWHERSDIPVSGLRTLLSKGADPTAVVSYVAVYPHSIVQHGKRTTALWDFLHHTQWVMWKNGSQKRMTPTHVVQIAADMLWNCPSVDQHGLLLRDGNIDTLRDPRHFYYSLNIYKKAGSFFDEIPSILSANVAYLLDLMLWFLPQQDEARLKNQVSFIRSKIEDPMISLRLLAITQDDHSLKCFQVVDQHPFQNLVDIIDARERNLQYSGDFAQWYDQAISLTEEKSVVMETDPRYVRRALAGGDLLGTYEFRADGLEYSEELHREVRDIHNSYARFEQLF
ncbi:hypothetical protein FSPOR_8110 [Fusarium sporotrichioides]|uniref:Uncharacterized protein n=1 Tax=Fusarium sporotrichioides TaxID=5514 RepID=A0A395RVW3_FUSSP|nr:hypothetical protein FSPOR_8110 [Fusarium sporotrichioides]